jgi:DNA-binding MarR family transcriptional regulator
MLIGDEKLDAALLAVTRAMVGATVRAGNAVSPALTTTQIRVLSLLAAAADGLSLTAIADQLDLGRPSASRICQRLVRDRLVTRSQGPGHEIRLALTSEGIETLGRLDELRLRLLRPLVDQLPSPQRAAAIDALTAFAVVNTPDYLS